MAGRCDHCGVEEYMPYVCKFCKGKFCAAHRLPENHSCIGLDAYRERVRAEGRVFAPEQEAPMTPRVSATARAGASMDGLWKRLDGKMTYIIMGICVGVYILEWVVVYNAPSLFDDLFGLTREFYLKPWTIVTSIFSHDIASFNHLLFNILALLFFGAAVERLIGTRRYTYLFLGAGAAAGLAQILLTLVLFPNANPLVLGASGGIQGLMGTLVVLAPTLTVLVFFVVPAPLWALTVLFALYDLFFNVFQQGSGVAGIAHLAGLAIGVAYGFHLRDRGLRVVNRPPEMQPRF